MNQSVKAVSYSQVWWSTFLALRTIEYFYNLDENVSTAWNNSWNGKALSASFHQINTYCILDTRLNSLILLE